MKILIYSPLFYPSIGGTETVVFILAHQFSEQGHEVKLVSQTPATDAKTFPFQVIRNPPIKQLLQLTSWCDVYFQAHVSLKGIWPLLIIRKPLIVTHQTWYCRLDGTLGWQDNLKKFVTKFAHNIVASHALAEQLPASSTIIPNPYREDMFFEIPEIPRNKELVFLGRLVSDKGADLLLEALAKIKALGLTPKLTIIGNGPEESSLREQAKHLEISDQVDFVGAKVNQELTKLLNAHKIMVIPSRWQEPFGIVALEGIACGCVVVGSEQGGLKDAINSCGVTFPNGDIAALTQILFDLLSNEKQLLKYQENAKLHLAKHQALVIAKSYINVFEKAKKR
ncbi:glycosyl transferase family 1 [[Phormidium ambiguum] IAM M-71]|uniref:Glycosyl transferase family 1 n=1 Tax=[Phormidium ambiguum] IAM M-71 TaxID=454136 RepID=A0A1U7ISN0_9CYAN|nr:glycosyltransferase family 4 protein [Phormidium ambiguum]OKH40423.1 glycosyl transferase family 1 [Phormidium ambiguum IAM M-71]